jgi:hypothetical protein
MGTIQRYIKLEGNTSRKDVAVSIYMQVSSCGWQRQSSGRSITTYLSYRFLHQLLDFKASAFQSRSPRMSPCLKQKTVVVNVDLIGKKATRLE